MIELLNSLYTLVVIVYIIACVFIVYHIFQYYLSAVLKLVSIVAFVMVSITLLSANITLFFSVNWVSFLEEIFKV